MVHVVVSGNEGSLKKLHTPGIYLIGGEKDIAYKNSEIDYQQIEGIPLFNANLDNVGHNGSLSKPFGGKMAQAAGATMAAMEGNGRRGSRQGVRGSGLQNLQ